MGTIAGFMSSIIFMLILNQYDFFSGIISTTDVIVIGIIAGGFGQLGTLFNTDAMYSIEVTLQPGENTFDVSWDMNNSFIIGYTFTDEIIAGLDSSPTSDTICGESESTSPSICVQRNSPASNCSLAA